MDSGNANNQPNGFSPSIMERRPPVAASPTTLMRNRASSQSKAKGPPFAAGPPSRKPVAPRDDFNTQNVSWQNGVHLRRDSDSRRGSTRSESPVISINGESIGSPLPPLPPLHLRDISLDLQSQASEQTNESSVLPSLRSPAQQYKMDTVVSGNMPQLQHIDIESHDGSIFSGDFYDDLSERGSGNLGQSSSSSEVQIAAENYPRLPPYSTNGSIKAVEQPKVNGDRNHVRKQIQYQSQEGQQIQQQQADQQKRGHRPTRSLGNWSGSKSTDSTSSQPRTASVGHLMPPQPPPHRQSMLSRPPSLNALTAEPRGRSRSSMLSPDGSLAPGSPAYQSRTHSRPRISPDSRPVSYIDLLNTPYAQQVAPAPLNLDNTQLRSVVGSNASLLHTKKTLEMYRANVKKTNDPAVQYEFAIFMVHAAHEPQAAAGSTDGSSSSTESGSGGSGGGVVVEEFLREARGILQRLSDRGYPFAQYYLADGYASGMFGKGKEEDYVHAFPLFVAASKHGHAESGYRAALCYEFGWGCRKDYAKAVQFYRAAASKNHPGAATRLGRACLIGDMGLGNNYREGLRWMRRAQESADAQYNSAPFELGVLHETGYGDDIFKDEAYAAQLFTQAAELGHPAASFRMGEAYEHGRLSCPKDPALSVHFYNCAAQTGVPEAMMALCAWYMVGAPPVLPKDEYEAFEWAKKAADMGESQPCLPKILFNGTPYYFLNLGFLEVNESLGFG